MAYTTINKSSDYFNTKLYTGNGSAGHSITGVGFQPDFVWLKPRDFSENHALYDSVRGVKERLMSNSDEKQETRSNGLSAFGADGFTVNADNGENKSSEPMVAWNWKAGTTSGLSGGTITPSSYSFNTTSGFSIIKYTGTGSNATVPHGLGKAPKMILFKDTANTATYWGVYHKEIGNEYRLTLNTNAARQGTSADYWSSTDPSSSLFYIGSNSRANASGAATIAYCFAEIPGFSKIGKYKGNNNADGPFVYTGFKPAFVIIKNFDTTLSWILLDNKRDTHPNPQKLALFPDTAAAETGDYLIDFNSNGFKIRTATGAVNGNAQDFAYIAFAEAPLVGSNNIPATAR